MRNFKAAMGTAVLAFAMLVSGGAYAQQNTCDLMDDLVALTEDPDLAPLVALLGETVSLVGAFACDLADFNGGPPLEGQDLPQPNLMLDGAFEFGVLDELINNPSLYTGLATGTMPGQVQAGVTVATVATANMTNITVAGSVLGSTLVQNLLIGFINSELTGQDPPLPELTPAQEAKIIGLLDSLVTIVAQYATLGDEDSVATLLWLAGLVNAAAADFGIELIPTTGYANTTPAGALGPDGDVDGDGYTNREEYDLYAGAKTAAEYVAAALDPELPGAEGEGEGEGEGEVVVTISGPGLVEEGTTVELEAHTGAITALSYQWSKLNSLGTTFVEIPDEVGPSLIFAPVELQNEGYYKVAITYDDGTKAVVSSLSPAFFLDVVPEGMLPIAGGLGIALLAGACAFAGAVSIRRKK